MSKKPPRMDDSSWWREWLSPPVLISLVGGLVFLGGAVLCLGYLLVLRMPDVERRVDKMEAQQSKFFARMDEDQNERFGEMETQLAAIRTNLVRLCAKGNQLEKACQTKELVAVVSGIARAHAGQFSAASVVVHSGGGPEISSPGLRSAFGKLQAANAFLSKGDSRQTVASALMLSSAADGATWEVNDGKLQASFSNGVATFEPKSSTSQVELNDISNEMDQASEVLRLTNP